MQFCQLSATSQRGWISFQPWQAKNVHNNCTTEQVSERVVLLYSPRREANAHKTSGWCRPRACFPLATTHCVECYENVPSNAVFGQKSIFIAQNNSDCLANSGPPVGPGECVVFVQLSIYSGGFGHHIRYFRRQ